MEATHIVHATSAHRRDSVTSTHSYGVRDHVQHFNSLAHAMHHIAANYNGKIHSLKESLQETHKMVSSAEAMLLESEQRCAEIRDVNSRLQHRLDSKVEQERIAKAPARRVHSVSISDRGDGAIAAEEISRLRAEVSHLRDREALQAKRISNLRQRLKEAEKDKIQMVKESRHLKEYIKHMDEKALSNSVQQNHSITQAHTDQYTINCFTLPRLDSESAGQHAARTADRGGIVESESATSEAVEPSASSSWLSSEKSRPRTPSIGRCNIKSQVCASLQLLFLQLVD
ncbi:hypothetical protein NLG97_g2604 [Lecanicillium saksenae]|uniref:Uncharacterized protein n=1 Tax=Lecanicillium saksenae TaxID=468837 RepID=A0ACC1R4H0_9HYPO|nr:hypothetical protein NLG97_g2604 [Lecanicillium saksenae]